ncbi:MAG: GNAT family N-acetyltransferase [Chthoniobacterales bacterium]
MKVLETARLNLRQLTLHDSPFFLAIMNEPAFIRNVADRGLRTPADAASYIAEKIFPSYEEFGFGMYVVELKDTGQPVGTCGLLKRPTMEDVDIGYAFLSEFWGKGYAFEAAVAVMDYGRNVLGLPKIVALTSPQNESSIKLLEKLGMRFERLIQVPGWEGESKLFV